MKSLNFYCTNCDATRKIIVKVVDAFYIIGTCEVCKHTVTVNRAKTKYSLV